MTKQRAIILEVIRSDMCHHTAEEIFELAKEKLPTISLATVYNNLHAMEEEKIIRKISGDSGPDRYDKYYRPHGHLFCLACGGIYDLSLPNLPMLISEKCMCDVESYELKVKGICSECKLKSEKQQQTKN